MPTMVAPQRTLWNGRVSEHELNLAQKVDSWCGATEASGPFIGKEIGEREREQCGVFSFGLLLYLHDGRDEDGRAEALEEKVAKGFKDGVGDKEDGEGGVELFGGVDANVVFQMGNLGVADVGAIQERHKVEERELRGRC